MAVLKWVEKGCLSAMVWVFDDTNEVTIKAISDAQVLLMEVPMGL
jgi:hypothetical protein